jgi:predicted nucleic acid-binding protein
VKTRLVDTGPLVAHLDATDPVHPDVAACLDPFTGQLATSSAVITEAMHLVAAARDGPRLLAEFVSASGIQVCDLSRPPELDEAVVLMEKYVDAPMDFADATLVLLAEGLGVHEILTLDRRGFTTYSTRQRRTLRLVLDQGQARLTVIRRLRTLRPGRRV